jgi:glycosyltransferase involved in cell wall biosynthesis
MVRVSASMIARDEEAGIGRAIASLRKVCAIDEVVVLDTGSRDRTVEIAADLGAIVRHQAWQDDFAFHRNHCLGLVKNDWVFILDGDEVLTDPGNLDAFFETPRGNAAAVTVSCQRHGRTLERLLSPRAIDRRTCRWKYPIHNQVIGLDGVTATTARIVAHYDETAEETTRGRLQVLLAHHARDSGDPHYAFFITQAYQTLGDSAQVLQ